MAKSHIGKRTLHEFAAALEAGYNAGDMGHVYDGYKDLNEFWIQGPEARRLMQPQGQKAMNDTAWNQIRSPLNL